MRVIRGFSTDPLRPSAQPFPNRNGIFIEFRGGDVCDPLMVAGYGGNWFHAPWPKYVLRAFAKYPLLPFISYRFGKRGGYMGWKIYGVDSLSYLNWLPSELVYNGSQALHLSIRPFASLK